MRDGKRQTLNIRAGTRPSEAELNGDQNSGAQQPGEDGATVGQSIEGMTVTPITSALRQQPGLGHDASELAERIDTSFHAAEGLLNALLDISRLDA
ncbi:MAG: hypothetical protein J0H51_20335, partial [Rhizobiales bacterium]|nr:hypothetical protein [Hyphomicrobiales bacterium]